MKRAVVTILAGLCLIPIDVSGKPPVESSEALSITVRGADVKHALQTTKRFAEAILAGKGDPADFASGMVFFGPGLFERLKDTDIAGFGINAATVFMAGGVNHRHDMKVFLDHDGDHRKCLASRGLRTFLRTFLNGPLVVRPASDEERTMFYAMINFEIEGKPVSIIEDRTGRALLVWFFDGDPSRGIAWLELISRWHRDKGDAKPR